MAGDGDIHTMAGDTHLMVGDIPDTDGDTRVMVHTGRVTVTVIMTVITTVITTVEDIIPQIQSIRITEGEDHIHTDTAPPVQDTQPLESEVRIRNQTGHPAPMDAPGVPRLQTVHGLRQPVPVPRAVNAQPAAYGIQAM